MFVRQLIGPQAGEIIEMPHLAAQNCLSNGTVQEATDEEISAAGLKAAEVTPPAKAESLPPGYRVEEFIAVDEADEKFTPGGYDVFDAGGVMLTAEHDIPNLAAARSFAWDHYEADQKAATQPSPAATAGEGAGSEPETPKEPEWDPKWRDAHWMTQVKLAKQFDDTVTKKDEAIQVLESVEERRKADAAAKKEGEGDQNS